MSFFASQGANLNLSAFSECAVEIHAIPGTILPRREVSAFSLYASLETAMRLVVSLRKVRA